ncbi:MAG: hypothetical protein ACU0A5_10780 [Salipiger marinus]|uniref:hypothetical protein n=1 Tax=Salipiger marinus TaxID=555512 RepID=UPI00405A3260
MPDNGVRTIDLTSLASAEDLLAHNGGTLGMLPLASLSTRLAASGALADLLASKLSSEDLAGLAAAVAALEAVAQEANPVYPDEETGRAAVGDGVQFRVAPASADESYRVYERVDAATISTLVTVVPSVADFTEKASVDDLENLGAQLDLRVLTDELPDGWHLAFTNALGTYFVGGFQDKPGGGVRFVPFDLLIPASATIEGEEATTLVERMLPAGLMTEAALAELEAIFGTVSEDGQYTNFVIYKDGSIWGRISHAIEAESVAAGGVTLAALAPEVAERLTAPRYVAELTSAGLWACNLQTGARVSIAGVGASDPEIVGDAIVYTLDGARVWRPVDASVPQAPVFPAPGYIVIRGDSLGAASAGIGSVGDLLGITTVNRSVGGWSVNDIALRAGAIQPQITVEGDTLPGTGSVAVTAIVPATGWTTYVPVSFAGTLAGVPVTLAATAGASTFTVTRVTDGDPVAIPAGTLFTATEEPVYREYVQVIAPGRNAVTTPTFVADTLAAVAAMVANLTPLYPRRVVLGVSNSQAEPAGSEGHTKIVDYNALAAETFGAAFYDIWADFKEFGLAMAGITPTTDDVTALADDLPPPSLMADAVHPNTTGYGVLRQLLANWLTSKGWF